MSSLVNAAQVADSSTLNTPGATTSLAPHDVNQLHQRIRDLERELNTDHLTGIANRRAFSAHARRLTTPAVIALVDVDQFKPINDTYGHQVGDSVLQSVAHRLRAALVPYGLAARLAGDEFALLIDQFPSETEVLTVAKRVLHVASCLVAAPLTAAGKVFTIRSSTGAALMKENESFTTVLHRADVAMYRAKNTQTGLVTFYNPELDTLALDSEEKPQLRVRDLPTLAPRLHQVG